MPELVDLDGRLVSGATIDWRGIPLADRFAEVGPVCVEADVRAAALAEAKFGAGRPFRLFAYVSIGTGISYTLVQHGRPYAGARGNALVRASSPASVLCPDCGSWVRTVLEDFAGGPGLVRRYNIGRAEPVARGEDVLAAAGRGDPDAAKVVRDAGEAVGAGVGWLVNVLDPEAIVVGGGLGLAPGRFRDRLIEATRDHIWNPGARGLPFVSAALGAHAGLIGAALTSAAKSIDLLTTSERR
jgi:glucokinase